MTFVQSITTVFLSGVSAALVTFIMTLRRDQFLGMQRKAEELYLAAEEFDRNLGAVFVTFLPAMKDGVSTSHPDVVTVLKDNQQPSNAHARMKMLASIYFPTVLQEIERHDKVRARIMGQVVAYEHGRGDIHSFDADEMRV